MLRLKVQRGPVWIDLAAGVRVHVMPMLSEIRMRASQALPIMEPDSQDGVERDLIYTKAVARSAIIAWEGVGDEHGAPAPITPEGIDALMDVFEIMLAFRNSYILPGLTLVAEGNGSAPSPNGTTAAGVTTAAPARKVARRAQGSSSSRKASKAS